MVRLISMVGCLLLFGCSNPATSTPAAGPGPNEPAKVPGIPPLPPGAPTEKVAATPDTVGTKGKDYGGGILTEPLAQRWRLQDRIILLAVQNCMNLYNAEHGRYPASHEEFMEKIVTANMIKLPDLPPGQRYIYDPETHELMVERPAAAKS